MNGHSGDESDKTEKKSKSEVATDEESAVVSSNRHSMLQEWQKFIRHFNSNYNQDFLTSSVRKRFCNAAIDTLQLLCDSSKGDKRLKDGINIKSVIDSLRSAQSNVEIIKLLKNLPNDAMLKKLVRNEKIPMDLGRLIVHMRARYFSDLLIDHDKIMPISAFEYKKLVELRSYATITTGDFRVLSSTDFLIFDPIGATSSVNDTKLRLSVAKDQFDKAWDLIKGLFLSPDSPIYKFKIINLKTSSEKLNKFIEQYQKVTFGNGVLLSDDKYYQKQMAESQRLTAGGQITIYLPHEMNSGTYERITEFFEKVTQILRDNEIVAGVQPDSDRHLTDYLSGRVGGTEFNYIPSTNTTRNSTDQVLEYFSNALNRIGSKPTG